MAVEVEVERALGLLSLPSTVAPELPGAELHLTLDSSARSQSYRLTVAPRRVEIRGADAAGLFYGLGTLCQWAESYRRDSLAAQGAIGCVRIEDWPSFERRGVMMDISRGKVPTLSTLFEVVDKLAHWKINELQLYTEHTFAYRGHETVWRGWSPMTAEEVRDLDAYCRRRFVELVPNQNSFGHLHRWLMHEPYRALAEVPEGVDHPFSRERQPFSLCPTDPGSLELLEDLYDQLLPNFSSSLFNVGLDETFDLGLGRSRALCERRGRGRVYLDFLEEIHRRVGARGRRMQFWGDIVVEHPELVERLPEDVVPLLWGYGAAHPFDEQCDRFRASGLDYYVCPGTSSWNSFAGRLENALLNLGRAAVSGRSHGAIGYLITDWGDNGHLQPLAVSMVGLLAGACFAWNADSAARPLELPMAELLDRFAYETCGLGEIAVELADVYQRCGKLFANSSALFNLLIFADETLQARHLDELEVEPLLEVRVGLGGARQRLRELAGKPTTDGTEIALREWSWVVDILDVAVRLGIGRLEDAQAGEVSSLPAQLRGDLRGELERQIATYRELHLARNRAGGAAYSVSFLERIAELL